MNFIKPLENLAAVWGNHPQDWSVYETLERIEFIDDEFERDRITRLNLELLHELSIVFQNAIEFRVSVGEKTVFSLKARNQEEDLLDLCKETENSPTVRVYLRINKARLIETHYHQILKPIEGEKQAYLYVFHARLNEYFKNSSLEDLEKYMWKYNKYAVVLFILPHVNSFLVGPKMLVLGGEYITPKNCFEVTEQPQKEIDLAENSYSVCRETLKWGEGWLKMLTPWHVFIRNKERKTSELHQICQAHFGNAFLLYTADYSYSQTINSHTARISRYTMQDKTIEVIHNPSACFDGSTNAENILKMLNWVYDRQWTASDRMTLAQSMLVDPLRVVPESDRYRALFEKSGAVLQNIERHWETFTSKKIDRYFDMVKEIEDYLSGVVSHSSEHIGRIQKSLTDTILIAVAVWIGSFAAASFNQPFNAVIFRFGLIVYAAYMLLFPLFYNMGQQWKRYIDTRGQISRRKDKFVEYLPAAAVDETWENWKIDEVHYRFTTNFFWTIVLYLFVIVASIVFALLIPEMISPSISIDVPALFP